MRNQERQVWAGRLLLAWLEEVPQLPDGNTMTKSAIMKMMVSTWKSSSSSTSAYLFKDRSWLSLNTSERMSFFLSSRHILVMITNSKVIGSVVMSRNRHQDQHDIETCWHEVPPHGAEAPLADVPSLNIHTAIFHMFTSFPHYTTIAWLLGGSVQQKAKHYPFLKNWIPPSPTFPGTSDFSLLPRWTQHRVGCHSSQTSLGSFWRIGKAETSAQIATFFQVTNFSRASITRNITTYYYIHPWSSPDLTCIALYLKNAHREEDAGSLTPAQQVSLSSVQPCPASCHAGTATSREPSPPAHPSADCVSCKVQYFVQTSWSRRPSAV